MSNRNLTFSGVAALAAFITFLVWHWGAERQVQLHQQTLLAAVEDRHWEKVGELFAASYSDRWGFSKDSAIDAAREVFRQFIVLDLSGDTSSIQMGADEAEVTTRLKLIGRGGPIAEMAVSRVNVMRDPWTFRWQKQSAWPWDWQLISVDQPELEAHRTDIF